MSEIAYNEPSAPSAGLRPLAFRYARRMVLAGRALGVRRILRPATGGTPTFELAYVRSGPPSEQPIVVIPGGPGLGSILPYRGLRRLAASGGLDLIMVEHRGIGFSRNDLRGKALPQSSMWVTEVLDDIAAVLDAEGVRKAFVAGSSYGSYLASGFGARHPERVAGMVLDSALQSASDLALEREVIRGLFWDADDEVAAAVRQLDARMPDEHGLLDVVRAAYELGGIELLGPLLDLRLRHGFCATWKMLESYARRDESIARVPGYYEFDIAGAIGFRELGYGAPADGLPLDPAQTYAPLAGRFPGFVGEPYDLRGEAARFGWPMALLTGRRDVRTPPAIAHRVAQTAPDAVQVWIDNGHSALESHPAALLNTIRALVSGQKELLPAMGAALDALPRFGAAAQLPGWLKRTVAAEQALRR